MHAHDNMPIQLSLCEVSLLVTTESKGSVSETLGTLGSDISLDCGTADTSPTSEPDTVSDVTVDEEDKTPAPVCFAFFDDEVREEEGAEPEEDESEETDGLEELDGSEEEPGVEEDESEADDVFGASKSGKYGSGRLLVCANTPIGLQIAMTAKIKKTDITFFNRFIKSPPPKLHIDFLKIQNYYSISRRYCKQGSGFFRLFDKSAFFRPQTRFCGTACPLLPDRARVLLHKVLRT